MKHIKQLQSIVQIIMKSL